jgi:SAM-dependent methyltransferase
MLMSHRVCPWWLGYLLANPIRRLLQDPDKLLASYVCEGMTVLEPGPGMGFFTLPLARRVGVTGRVVAVDVQPKMITALKRRAARAGLLPRVDARVVAPDSMGLTDLPCAVDFTLAFALVHELPSADPFFREIAHASKPGAGLLFVEPSGHVKPPDFETELQAALRAGFELVGRPLVRRSHAALMKKG